MQHSVKWRSPSNIALVKYWGKFPNQIPANPSISFTLQNCYTETEVFLSEKKSKVDFDFSIFLDDKRVDGFKPKTENFFRQITSEADFLKNHRIEIKTYNSFPHSSGIASSASGMCALALCVLGLKEKIEGKNTTDFYKKASEWARSGSGSACRSIYGGLVEWGKFEGIAESSDEFAVPYQGAVNEVFMDFQDYVLLVETGSKKVSSTTGHGLMKNHPFAEKRFLQAHENLAELLKTIESGDLHKFGKIVESEALTLHAMMMTSNPYFILMKPNTVSILEKIWEFRKETKLPAFFTLDAGANVHLLFPKKVELSVKEFVNNSLIPHLQNGKYICDQVGSGPEKLS